MNGVLIIDKPAGMTSHDVVNRVRRILHQPSVGHLGTLDPLATGVLPLVTGNLTRLAQFYGGAEKTYEGVIRFGFATDTYDSDGEPQGPAQTVHVSLEQTREAAGHFVGLIEQMPPPFSAKKIKGVPAYKLARKHQEVDLKPVQVEIKEFEILSAEGDRASFRVRVASGTYVRSIAHEMGQQLGCGAHLESLRRTVLGEFDLSLPTHWTLWMRLQDRKRRRIVHSSTAASAGISVRQRQRRCCSADSQRALSELAGSVKGAPGKGIRRTKGTDRHRNPNCRDSVPSQDRACD